MEIRELEEKLELVLPPQYQALLSNYPTELRGLLEQRELFSSIDRVCSENVAARETMVGDKSWPLHMIVVGEDDSGNLHVIDNRTEPAGIWLYRRKDQSFSMIASSLSHWFPSLHEKAMSEAQ